MAYASDKPYPIIHTKCDIHACFCGGSVRSLKYIDVAKRNIPEDIIKEDSGSGVITHRCKLTINDFKGFQSQFALCL